MDWNNFHVVGCHICGALTECGNFCCREKNKGPYHRLIPVPDGFPHFISSPDTMLDLCEVCGIAIDANVSWDMDYDRCVIIGNWATHSEVPYENVKAAILRYQKSYDNYIYPRLAELKKEQNDSSN